MIAILFRVILFFFFLALVMFIVITLIMKWLLPMLMARGRVSCRTFERWNKRWAEFGKIEPKKKKKKS